MSKSYNTDIVKFASKIRKRNQGMIDDYAKAQQKQALIGSIGNALTGVVGAYGQYKQQQQQKAASQQIGAMPELGLSSDVSSQIAPNQLLSAALAIRARNQVRPMTPLQQAELDYKKAQLAQMPEEQKRAAELASATMDSERAQAEADRALAQDRLRTQPTGYMAFTPEGRPVNADPNTPGALELPTEKIAENFLEYGKSQGGTGLLTTEQRQERDRANRAVYKAATGKDFPEGVDLSTLDHTTLNTTIAQSALTGRADTANTNRQELARLRVQAMTEKERRDNLVKLTTARANLLQSSEDNVAKLISGQISAAQMSAGSPGRTLQDFSEQASGVIGGIDLGQIDAMIQELQAATGGVKPLAQKHIDIYNAASPEEKARMKQEAAAAGFDVSGLK